jgi:hypothetical protein
MPPVIIQQTLQFISDSSQLNETGLVTPHSILEWVLLFCSVSFELFAALLKRK